MANSAFEGLQFACKKLLQPEIHHVLSAKEELFLN